MTRHEHLHHHLGWGFQFTNLVLAFLAGVIVGVGIFAMLLFYLDTSNTDVGFLNGPSTSPKTTCYSLQKLGLNVWLCHRHHEGKAGT